MRKTSDSFYVHNTTANKLNIFQVQQFERPRYDTTDNLDLIQVQQ